MKDSTLGLWQPGSADKLFFRIKEGELSISFLGITTDKTATINVGYSAALTLSQWFSEYCSLPEHYPQVQKGTKYDTISTKSIWYK